MADKAAEELPVFDLEDVRLVGWECGRADDGDMVLQARCPGCGTAHYIKLPPGSFVRHDPVGVLHADGLHFGGPMAAAAHREVLPGDGG